MLREFLAGAGLLGRGIVLLFRSPRLLLLGALPALLAFAVLATGYTFLLVFLGDEADLLTPFADGWSPGWRTTAHVAAGIALAGAGLVVAALLFTTLALTIGDPCYEAISRHTERQCGGLPDEVEVAWWRSLGRSARDALRMLVASAVTGVVLFAAGFLPAVGQTVVPVLGALIGGWYLALELTGVAYERRGLRLAQRRRVLRRYRPRALGFGVAVFVLFLVPFGALIGTPAAVAGATLLARHTLGDPITVRGAAPVPG
ncbi:membrane protein [Actinocatenispora thailandica]|uniref:Membrane protein n=1 Tax=Actinocatenispora thailandica TaxID=227318 RepID=A0A7R7DJD7_9ACTN|nr:EI24 domain-containing protein [Actinocatenispora thailandica]BCJ32566.1 membrane protein [Actinocatenispora thailandica]